MYVKISYDPDLSKIGSVVEVGDDQAREMINAGRATVSRKPAPKKKTAPKKTALKKAAPRPGPQKAAGRTSPPHDSAAVETAAAPAGD